MSKPLLKESLAAISKAMDGVGLQKLAQAVDRLIGSRSQRDHARWDQTIREPAAKAVLESLETQAASDEELTPDTQALVSELPEVEEKLAGVIEKDDELLPIEETGGLRTSNDHVASRQPADILWSLVRLQSSEKAVRAFFSRKLGLRDDNDWHEFKRRRLDPILEALRNGLGEAYSNVLWSITSQASRMYGCKLEKLLPEDVYTRAFQFYTDCGLAQSVTFSTSSGLPNPLERHGTDWFLERYNIDPASEAVADLLLKNPFRTDNFAKGILNAQLRCDRLYVWEERGTSRALRKAYEAVPNEKKDLFVSDAVARLAECLAFPELRIIEIQSFSSWMTRLTRNGPNSIMISFRGPISKRISHAVNINFTKAEDIDRILRLVLPVGAGASGALFPHIALGILWAVAIGFEIGAYEVLKKKVFTRGFDWQKARIDGLDEIKPFGRIPESDVARSAEATVHRLLSPP